MRVACEPIRVASKGLLAAGLRYGVSEDLFQYGPSCETIGKLIKPVESTLRLNTKDRPNIFVENKSSTSFLI